MNRTRRSSLLVSLLAVVLLGGSAGCTPTALVAGAFTLGTLFGQALSGHPALQIVVQRTCYRNGAVIDCTELGLSTLP